MNDLNKLVDKARQNLDAEEARQPSPVPGSARRNLKGPFAAALLVIAVTLLAQHFWGGRLTPEMINTDLSRLIDRANESITDYYRQNGQLPPYIPDPSLCAIIQYEVLDALSTPPRFRLQGEVDGVRLSNSSANPGGRP